MRKIIVQSNLHSLESANVAATLEDAEVVTDEVRDECEASADLAMETFSLMKRIAALEDIAQVIETEVIEARPSEAILVDIATDLAVADTDAESEDVTPGLESAIGGAISTEGIRDTIKRFVAAIKDRVKRLKDQLVASIASNRKLVSIIRERIAQTKKAIESAELSESVKSIPGLNEIATNGKVAKSVADLTKNVSELKRAVNAIYNGYDTDARTLAKDLETAFDVKKDTDRVVIEVLTSMKKLASRRTNLQSSGEMNGHPIVLDTGKNVLINLWPVAAGRLQSLTTKTEDPVKLLHEIRYESTFFTAGTSPNKKKVSTDAKGVQFEDVSKATLTKLLTEIQAAVDFTEAQLKKATESAVLLENMYDKMDDYMASLADTDPTGAVAQKMYVLDETVISSMTHHFEGLSFLSYIVRALNSASLAAAKCAKV